MPQELRDQLQLFAIENPCIGVCQANNRGYCNGCFRSREERFHWHRLTDSDKRKVLTLCKRREKRRQLKKQIEAAEQQPLNLSLFDDYTNLGK